MNSFTLTALGTHWTISLDGGEFSEKLKSDITVFLEVFNSRFSRFVSESEAHVKAGTHAISAEFAEMLTRADELRRLTCGSYDPVIARVLEDAGYNKDYRLTPVGTVTHAELPAWSLAGNLLTVDRDVTFDLGGIGKGYAIDRVAQIVLSHGQKWYLVEGGGDMVATTKQDGSGWRVAVEWPGKTDTAAAVVTLNNQGFAASDTVRRRWGAWHHIVDAKTMRPVSRIMGCATIAPTAFDADTVTSALFFAPQEDHNTIIERFDACYLVFCGQDNVLVSTNWEGERFF